MNEALKRIRPALRDWCGRRMDEAMKAEVSPDQLTNHVVAILRGQNPRTLASLQAAAHLAMFRALLAAERGEFRSCPIRQTA